MALLYAVARLGSFFYRTQGYLERLGFYPLEAVKKLSTGYNVWLHAASAGEVNAIMPFCQAFRKAKPEARIILTTTSQMGKKIATERGIADAVFLAPLDMGPCLKRAFAAFRPVMVLVAETEFWPNWLLRTGRNGVPLLLINGRISDRSFPSYRRLRSLFGPALNQFTFFLVQTPKDGEKLAALGVSSPRILVIGQMKYDRSAPDSIAVQQFKEHLSLSRKDVIYTLGSLRGGEDNLLLPLVPEILGFAPEVKVIIAPRHLQNAVMFQEKLQGMNVESVRRTQLERGKSPERVIILDTVGELSQAYALSRATFVGGTLVPLGGHNVMEPALSSVPVCFGPYTQNVSEAAEALERSGGGVRVKDGKQLVDAFHGFLNDDQARETGKKARESVLSMRGATDATVERVLHYWPLRTS